MTSVRKIRNRNKHYRSIDKCPNYFPGCPNCELWKFFDYYGRFPYSFDEFSNSLMPVPNEDFEEHKDSDYNYLVKIFDPVWFEQKSRV